MKVTFYHRPGCANNEKQKKILRQKGFLLEERDLLKEQWTRGLIEKVFKGYLVSEWFNPSAPSIKDGSIQPNQLTYDEAIELILEDPINMRRPIMELENRYIVGFSIKDIEFVSGKMLGRVPKGLDNCAMKNNE
jgi:nitrogenase-associated protein